MEKEMQQQYLHTIEMLDEKTVDNPSTSNDPSMNLGEAGTFDSPNLHSSQSSELMDQLNAGKSCANQDPSREGPNCPLKNHELQLVVYDPSIASAHETGNHMEGQSNPSDNLELQLVLYDPSVNGGARETGNAPSPYVGQTECSGQRAFPNRRRRGVPEVFTFTIQCASCLKWRLIPTKEKYEELREHIMERPFFCETGREWRSDMSCNEPTDIAQDGSHLWAIDRPSIAQTPPGWQRKLRIRAERGTKFADVYYISPTGKQFRSLVEVERFFTENPEYMVYQLPRPLQRNYVRSRPSRPAPASDAPLNVAPISWALPADTAELVPRTSSSGHSDLMPEDEPAKRQRTTFEG